MTNLHFHTSKGRYHLWLVCQISLLYLQVDLETCVEPPQCNTSWVRDESLWMSNCQSQWPDGADIGATFRINSWKNSTVFCAEVMDFRVLDTKSWETRHNRTCCTNSSGNFLLGWSYLHGAYVHHVSSAAAENKSFRDLTFMWWYVCRSDR